MAYRVGSEVAIYSPSEDAGSGSTLPDLVGSNDGTITNATRETDTDSGGSTALEFSSGHVVVPNSGDFAFGTDPFWFSVWFKLTSTSQQMILDKGYDTGNPSRLFFILLNSTTFRIWPGDIGAVLDFTATGYLNTWFHAAFQRNGTSVAAWLNGTLAASNTSLSASKDLTNTDNLTFGARSDEGAHLMAGRMDAMRFGTGVLTSGQRAKLASSRVPATLGSVFESQAFNSRVF